MPCRSEHMEPNEREKESKLVAEHLEYIRLCLDSKPDLELYNIVTSYYGAPDKVDELTTRLCFLLRNLSKGEEDYIIYNARSRQSRRLADWWEQHQEFDKNGGR